MLDSRRNTKFINKPKTILPSIKQETKAQVIKPVVNIINETKEVKDTKEIKETKEKDNSSECNCSDCVNDESNQKKNKFEKIVDLIEKRIVNKKKFNPNIIIQKKDTNDFGDELFIVQMSQVFKNISFLNNYFNTCINHLDTLMILFEKINICKNDKDHLDIANKEFNNYLLNALYNNLPVFYNQKQPNTTIKFPFLVSANEEVNKFISKNIGSNNTHITVKLIKISLEDKDISEKINTHKLMIENNIKFINIKKDLCNNLVSNILPLS